MVLIMEKGFTRLKNYLKELNEGILRANKPLRFGLGFLRVSELIQQLYCELKLHYTYSQGVEPEYKRRYIIRKMLDIYLNAEKKAKATNGNFYVKLPLIAPIREIPVIGSPDAIFFERYNPKIILRIRKSRSLKIYPEDEARGLIYGALLEKLGFKINDLKYVIIIAKDLEGLLELIPSISKSIVKREGISIKEKHNVRIAVRVYNSKEAEELINYLLSYWEMLREPRPNPSKSKCYLCKYSRICPYSSLESR